AAGAAEAGRAGPGGGAAVGGPPLAPAHVRSPGGLGDDRPGDGLPGSVVRALRDDPGAPGPGLRAGGARTRSDRDMPRPSVAPDRIGAADPAPPAPAVVGLPRKAPAARA